MEKYQTIQNIEQSTLHQLLRDKSPASWLLMLDVDGTLLDIANNPFVVNVPMALKETLMRLHDITCGAFFLISGRSIEDLDILFEPLRLNMVGQHGAEIRIGGRVRYYGPKTLKKHANELTDQCQNIAAEFPGVMIEPKPLSVAVHYRRIPDSENEIRKRLSEILKNYGDEWEIMPGKMVFEIKPWNFSKSRTVKDLIKMSRFRGRKPVYAGDDITDEDALQEVRNAGGYAIKVGGSKDEGMLYADNADQVRRWLTETASQNMMPATQPLRNYRPHPFQNKGRIIVLSNRVSVRNTPSSGGLAVAMSAVLQKHGGIWMGWSDKINNKPAARTLEKGNVKFVLRDLTQQEHEQFYQQFCNGTLWPLLHYNIGLIDFSWNAYESYKKVNEQFAELLAELLEPSDCIWVHDFHFIPIAEALRCKGVTCRIGFFLHTPFPTKEMLLTMPVHRELMSALLSYNLVGFQTQRDLAAFRDYAISENIRDYARYPVIPETVTGHFPIGIQTTRFSSLSRKKLALPEMQDLKTSLVGRKLILGVDRLDYSKGIGQRMKALEELLAHRPILHKEFSFLQISPPTREGIETYEVLRTKIETMVGHINGKYADVDWTPIRFLVRGISRELLAGYYRMAKLCLVTPLRDGMNLVAKEFVAAQDPQDPGVLIISRFAGAAEELTEALLVNPYDIEEISFAIERGLTMPLSERKQRWNSMYRTISQQTLERWYQDFLQTLVE